MANLTSTGDIKAAVLQHAGELTNGNSKFDPLALGYINRVYMEIIGGGSIFMPEISEPWAWAKAQTPGVLTLLPPHEEGTVSLTNASRDGTFSVAPTTSLMGRFLKVDGRSEFYRISMHIAGQTAFQLDAIYLGTTGALTYKAHALEYTLGTVAISRLIEPMRVYKPQIMTDDQQGKILGIAPDELTAQFPLQFLFTGVPSHFAVVGEVNGIYKVRFNASVAEETRVEYDYVPIPADLSYSSTPLVPREDRMVLVYGAVYWLMVDKEDPRAETFFRLTQAKLQSMYLARRKEYGRTGRDYGRMIPRQDNVNGMAVVRSASGLRY